MIRSNKPWRSIVILFVILNGLMIAARHKLESKGFNVDVLIVGNLVIFLATSLSFIIAWRSTNSTNPNASVRSLYGSFMIKFFIIIIAAFAYIMIEKKNLNKPALYTCMALYIVYTFVEITTLQIQLRKKKNA